MTSYPKLTIYSEADENAHKAFLYPQLRKAGLTPDDYKLVKYGEELPFYGPILALGKRASQQVTGNKTAGVKTLRVGPPKTIEFPNGEKRQVVCTYSPAALWNNTDYHPDFRRDVAKVSPTYEPPKWSSPKWEEIDRIERLIEVIDRLYEDGRFLVLDVELDYDPSDPQPPQFAPLLCVGFSVDPENMVYVIARNLLAEKVLWLWGGKFLDLMYHNQVVAHNAKFDLAALRRIGWESGLLHWDTMLASYAVDERPGYHSLDYLSREFLGAPDWKHLVKGKLMRDVHPTLLHKYNAYDVCNTYRLWQMQEPDEELMLFLMDSSNTLLEVELNGIGLDVDGLRVADVEYQAKLATLESVLTDLGGEHNPRSPSQVMKITGTKDTTASTLEALDTPYSRALLEYRKASKIHSTYIQGLLSREHKGRIFTSFLLHGTVSGRLSSRNPNLQNLPRGSEVRKFMVPTYDRNYLAQLDYQAAELRALAWLTEDEYLIGVLSDPERDVHSEMAENIFGRHWTKEDRAVAKNTVFGTLYGQTPAGLAGRLGVRPDQAADYQNEFLSTMPQVAKWFKELESDVKKTKRVKSVFGHQRRFWYTGPSVFSNIKREARAWMPQNIASNICLEAANRLPYRDRIRLLVHDAIVVEVGKTDYRDYLWRVRKIMSDTGEEFLEGIVPMPVEVEVGPSWGEMEEVTL